ncbi:Uncharacterised protein [BD1-7 clade bacterium]|uniref:Uncharacterized protein n=1 Tax=BD1-7 clade bacterium TaxID=2029982 RepID=A0A5S9QGC3_9GAMM|nr:Uncharacterised protein [BD1-7 clade bacterium]CAA0117706.1 Uncharacterised protein [BD1-7 clade bacterium]
MNFSISIRTLFAMAAFIAAYVLSYFLLWDDQMKLGNFNINPQQSIVTRYLVQNVSWGMRGQARLFGVFLSFLSVHLCWGYRYWLGDRLMQFVGAYRKRKTVIGSKVVGGSDVIGADANFRSNDREISHENTHKRLSSDS